MQTQYCGRGLLWEVTVSCISCRRFVRARWSGLWCTFTKMIQALFLCMPSLKWLSLPKIHLWLQANELSNPATIQLPPVSQAENTSRFLFLLLFFPFLTKICIMLFNNFFWSICICGWSLYPLIDVCLCGDWFTLGL